VAKSTSGKLVSRVGAAGGGKTYRKARPANYYGVLAVVCILGLVLVVYSRYQYQNPSHHHTVSTPPLIGKTYYFALAADNCGTALPALTQDPTYKGSYHVQSSGIVNLTPAVSANAGKNATLANFATQYPGLTVSSSTLAIPGKAGAKNPATTFTNGATCATGTKYAGKKGQVEYAYWTSLGQTAPTITTDPSAIHLSNELRVTMAFVPKGVTPLAPSTAAVDEMVLLVTTPTTTTSAPTTTTTAPTTTTTGATTTTSSPPTTTSAPTTTTTKG
jgi:hypothetical protein